MDNIKIEYLPISDLTPYERNQRKHADYDISQIMVSIQKYGFNDPIGIWSDKNIIVEGHGRLAAAKKLHMKEVPAIRLDHLTDEQRKEYAIIHNKTAELSEWDMDLLAEDIPQLDFSDFEIDWGLPDSTDDENTEIEEDEAPEPPTEPKAKVGDLYEVGGHRLICGDSTDIAVIDRLMDGVKADMLLTDPPYNVDYTGKTKDALKIQNDKMDNDSFRQFLRDAFASADSVMRAGAVFYIWHADSEGYNFRGACADNNWKVRECLIWNKNSMVLGRQDYQWKHEPCLYGWKDGASHLWASDRKQTTILNFDRPNKADIHPTMKPVALFAYQIGNNTHEGDAVLDMFGGSGTTLMACEQLKRKAFICELDPRYVDAIITRYINYKGNDDDVYLIRDGQKIAYRDIQS